jgi:hypothetical protein
MHSAKRDCPRRRPVLGLGSTARASPPGSARPEAAVHTLSVPPGAVLFVALDPALVARADEVHLFDVLDPALQTWYVVARAGRAADETSQVLLVAATRDYWDMQVVLLRAMVWATARLAARRHPHGE